LLLLLVVAVPMKYVGSDPTLVRLLGPLHGMAFLAYTYQVFKSLARGQINRRTGVVLITASFFPGGTFWVMRSPWK